MNNRTKQQVGGDDQPTDKAAALSPIDRQARALLRRLRLRQEQVLRFMTNESSLRMRSMESIRLCAASIRMRRAALILYVQG
jgi:hypothetical protein